MADQSRPGPAQDWLHRELRERQRDRRLGIDNDVRAQLRRHAIRTGDDEVLRDYDYRHGLDRLKHVALLQLETSPGTGFPFNHPTTPEQWRMVDDPSRRFRLGTVGTAGEGLYVDPREILATGAGINGGTGTYKTTCLGNLCAWAATVPDIGCFRFNTRPEYNDRQPGFVQATLSDVLPNPFEHRPDLSPEEQANQIAAIIGDVFYFLQPRNVLAEVLKPIYEAGKSPTLRDVAREIWGIKSGASSGLTVNQTAKLKHVFKTLIAQIGTRNIDLVSGFNPEKHWNRNIVVVLDFGDPQIHTLFILYFLHRLYQHNIAHGYRDRLRTVFVVDESRYLLDPVREYQSHAYGRPLIDEIVCTERSAGLSLVAASQLAFPTAYAANIQTRVLLPISDSSLFQKAAQSMGLTREQVEWAKLNLEPGVAVVKTPAYNEPLVTILEPPGPLVDKHSAERASKSFLKQVQREFIWADTTEATSLAPKPSAEPRRQPVTDELVPGAHGLLAVCATSPLECTTQLYERLTLSKSKGNAAKKHLLRNRMVKACQVQLFDGGRGRHPVLLEPTDEGRAWLMAYRPDVEIVAIPGKGSLEHRIHAQIVANHYRSQGYEVAIEKMEADIVISHPTVAGWSAVEITNRNSKNIENRVQDNRDNGAQTTVVVCSDKVSLKRARKVLARIKDVHVQSIGDYLPKRTDESQTSLFDMHYPLQRDGAK